MYWLLVRLIVWLIDWTLCSLRRCHTGVLLVFWWWVFSSFMRGLSSFSTIPPQITTDISTSPARHPSGVLRCLSLPRHSLSGVFRRCNRIRFLFFTLFVACPVYCVAGDCQAHLPDLFHFLLWLRCSVTRRSLDENGVTDLSAEDVLQNIFATPPTSLTKSNSRTKVRQTTEYYWRKTVPQNWMKTFSDDQRQTSKNSFSTLPTLFLKKLLI